jgi:hypothetical protein
VHSAKSSANGIEGCAALGNGTDQTALLEFVGTKSSCEESTIIPMGLNINQKCAGDCELGEQH